MNENPSRHSGATAEGTQMNTGDGQGVEAAGDALKMPTEAEGAEEKAKAEQKNKRSDGPKRHHHRRGMSKKKDKERKRVKTEDSVEMVEDVSKRETEIRSQEFADKAKNTQEDEVKTTELEMKDRRMSEDGSSAGKA